jgi:hypothetical protein
MATHDHDAARSRERSGPNVSLDHGKKQNQARSTVQSQRKLFIHYERERGRRRERGWEGESSHASGKKETEEESVTLVFPPSPFCSYSTPLVSLQTVVVMALHVEEATRESKKPEEVGSARKGEREGEEREEKRLLEKVNQNAKKWEV